MSFAKVKSYVAPPIGTSPYGEFGLFYRNNCGDDKRIGVYQPVPDASASKLTSFAGRSILIAGANTDHTSLAYLANHLDRAGQDVRIIAIPGYDQRRDDDNPTRNRLLEGSKWHSTSLEQYWAESIPPVVEKLIETTPRGQPVFLGGFSVGGALATYTYLGLEEKLNQRVTGLILGAAAYTYVKLDPFYGFINEWYASYKADQGAMRVRESRPEGISDDIYYLRTRPWTSVHACILFSKRAHKQLRQVAANGKADVPVLLIHGGKSDSTVSTKSAQAVKKAFTTVEAVSLESGHWVFAGAHKEDAVEKTLSFIQRHSG